ncbi:hypothetical protein QBC41DRAFT_351568 [Cercophora samala]|uniref:F-box domain-containing protein n=1 Tax=Cercophora samala TaxID=330535 RepID=A0AA39YL60_9PEZI|nr:hypothetical protein QBC41DRAFT_351568 [Cercophora samala]
MSNTKPIPERDRIPDWLRSKEPYVFDSSVDECDVVRATSHTKADWTDWTDGHNLIFNQVPARRTSLQVDNTPVFPFGAPKTSLGLLDDHPAEILVEILSHTDIESLLRFMRTNRRAWNFVTDLPDCRFATKFGNQVIVTLITTKLASHITIPEINTALRTERCQCGEFAGLVFLFTMEKCCRRCIQEKKGNLGAHSFDNVEKESSWLRQNKPNMQMLSHPDLDGRLQRRWVYFTGGKEGESGYLAVTPMPYVNCQNVAKPRVSYGVYCVGCLLTIRVNGPVWPRLNLQTLYTVWGDLRLLRRTVYSFEGFLEHFKWCPSAQNLWKASKGGTQAVKVFDSYGWLRQSEGDVPGLVAVQQEEDETPEWDKLNREMDRRILSHIMFM